MEFFSQGLQALAAHAVAHQQQMQVFGPGSAGIQHGAQHHIQALCRGKRAGEHQVESSGKAGFQLWVMAGDSVKILAVL